MKLERLLHLAGIELDEATLAKYNEPEANHTKKTGGEEKKAPEGKLTVPSTGRYKDNNSTK